MGQGERLYRDHERSGFQRHSSFDARRGEDPSVVQIRAQDLSPAALGPTLLAVLRTHAGVLEAGAIVTLDLRTARVRTLPLS
jgi:hypothetical protein